jgi:protein-S-isoprenylcysteine O-methyltransferase Ste14
MTKGIIKAIPLGIAFIVLIVLAEPNPFSIIVGVWLVAIGEAVRIWASGHLMRRNELTTSGPYAYLRDPLYLGRLLLLVGFCIMAWGYNWILLILGLGVFFFNYMPRKYRKEMTRLEDLFGQEYTDYASYARSLIPRMRPYPRARQRNWRFDLFWRENREQYFVLGEAVLTLLIVWRFFLG